MSHSGIRGLQGFPLAERTVVILRLKARRLQSWVQGDELPCHIGATRMLHIVPAAWFSSPWATLCETGSQKL